MISGQLSAEISATCSALGHNDGITYNIDPYCKESIKDLIRFLRRDSEDHAVRRFLGNSKVLKTDLVPILIHHSDNDELFDVVLRLIMNLTTPALIVYQEQIPSDKSERNLYLQLISQLQEGKEAFTDPDVWNVLVKNIGKLLETESYERDEDTSRTLERILILARNVLAVPSDAEYERRPDNDATVHDKVLWAMHKARMDEIFLYIAGSEEQQVYMHILEIVSLMLREQNPSTLAKSEIQRSFSEKEKDEEELLAFRQAEIKSKQLKVKKYAGTRHFGGTYVMKGVKAAGDNDLIFHKPLDKAVNMEFNFEKKRIKWPKNLEPLKQVSEERKSTFGVRLFLKEFCVDLLNGAYNPLMRKVKDIIERGKSNGDESYYFWAMKFFMEFNRSYNFQVKLVSETLSIETFHFIQTQLENWNDMMMMEKKKIPLLSRRMHLALKAYREVLLTLCEMDKSPDEACRGSSQVLKSRVFYVTEYRDLLAILIHVFKKNRFSQMYMKDLLETLHIFMKMLQKFSEKHRGGLVVQQKKRVARRSGKKNSKSKSGAQQAANMEAIWDEVGPQLSAVLQTNAQIPTDVIPFDATSDVPIDEQKVDAMKRIQSLLKSGSFEEAIGLLRASRDVWPENNCFGAPDLQPEDEFMAVRDIFMADLGQPGGINLPGDNANNDDDEDEEDEEEYGDAPTVGYQESELNFEDFVRRFISEKTLQICGILLDKFENNSVHTNHCIVKLLHRIAVDCRMPAMVFQASLFRIFQRAMSSPNPEHKELRRFGRFIVQKFIETAEKNSKVFIELLFWKKIKDAVEITEGYGTTSTKSHSVKNMWTEEQEDELSRLCNEFMSTNPPGSNPVDWIMENLINRERSRISVIKKLKELHLWSRESVAELKRSAREWSQEEEDQLRELVPEFLNAENPMECIMSRLIGNRSKSNVIRKILDLGLVEDRKQLRKKKSRKSREKGRDGSDESNSSSGGSSDDEAAKKEPVVTFEKVVEVLNNAVFDGFKEPLEWLVSSMTEMLEDLEDNQEDVPLLPLTETCTQAMENASFTSMVEVLGMKRPDEQEVFWRLPGNWTEAKIKDMIRIIKDAIEGNLSTASDPGSFKAEKVQQKKSKEKPKKKKNKRPEKKTFKNILDDLDRSGDDSNTDMENSRQNANRHSDSGSDSAASRRSSPKSSRNARRNSDSSSDSSKNNKKSRARKSGGSRMWLDSDSDSDEKDSSRNKKKTNGTIESDSEKKSSQKSHRTSDNEHSPESSNSKRKETRKRAESRRQVLESDSDSEGSSKKTNGKLSSQSRKESDSDSGGSRVNNKKRNGKFHNKLWRSSDSDSNQSSVTNTQASEKNRRNNGDSRSDNKRNKVSDDGSDSRRGSPRSSQVSSRIGSQRKKRDSSSDNNSDSRRNSPRSSQVSSRIGSQSKNRDSSSDNNSDSRRGSPRSSQVSSRIGSQSKNRGSSSDNNSDSNRGSPRSSQVSSRIGSQRKNRGSSSDNSDSKRGSQKSSQITTQQSSHFGSQSNKRDNSSDNNSDSNRASPRSSQKSSHFRSQRSNRDSSPESPVKNGQNETRKRSDSLSSVADSTQASVLNSSQLKRKRYLNSSSDNSDDQGKKTIGQRKKTTKKIATASSESEREGGNKGKTDVMIVDDDDDVPKSSPSENGVKNIKPKRKRIVIGSDSDD